MRDAEAAEIVIAPVLLRIGAFFIDVVILSVINLALATAVGDQGIENRGTFGLIISVTAAYHIGFVASRSATPGKMALKLRISDLEGRPVRPDTAILRYLVLFIGNLGVIDPLLTVAATVLVVASIVMLFVDSRRRTMHDRIARTLVVMAPRPEQEGDGRGR